MNPALAAAPPVPASPSKPLQVALWLSQALLALAFGMAGVFKSTQPIAALAKQLPWVASAPSALVRFIGLSELAGALGVILPAATRVKPWLTPVASLGLVAVMVLASGFHLVQGELSHLPVPFLLGALAAFVAWGRFKKAPIAAR